MSSIANTSFLLITGSVGCRVHYGAPFNVAGFATVAAGAPTYYWCISTSETPTMYVENNPRLNSLVS